MEKSKDKHQSLAIIEVRGSQARVFNLSGESNAHGEVGRWRRERHCRNCIDVYLNLKRLSNDYNRILRLSCPDRGGGCGRGGEFVAGLFRPGRLVEVGVGELLLGKFIIGGNYGEIQHEENRLHRL